MHILLGILIEVVLLLIVIWGVGYLWETHLNSRPGRVLYHGSNIGEQGPLVAAVIERYIGRDTAPYALVEPGAGMATMARYLARQFKWREVSAIEIGPFIIMMGRLRFLFSRSPVRLVRADIFNYAFPKKSVVYCYLFPSLITRLYTEGAFRGQLVISLTFQIENCQPTERIGLGSWQSALYVYDFRQG